MPPDRIPADILEFVARRRFAEDIGTVAKKKPGVEPAAGVRRSDRSPDIGEHVKCRNQAALSIGSFDLPGSRRRSVRACRPAYEDPDFFPGLPQRCSCRARKS